MTNIAHQTQTLNWTGVSRSVYQYWIYPIESRFVNKPGNYIFAQQLGPDRWKPIYVGQTDDLGRRLSNHEKAACAKRKGATHIHAHINDNGEDARLNEERDLIVYWKPACNEQHT